MSEGVRGAGVAWEQRAGMGSAVAGFEIESDPPRSAGNVSVSATDRNVLVEQLGTSAAVATVVYRFRVHVLGAGGERTASAWSVPVNVDNVVGPDAHLVVETSM